MQVKTKEDALLHCFDLWLWLAMNPRKGKREWPGWKAQGGYLQDCQYECPACEYVKRDWDFEMDKSCEDDCIISWSDRWCEDSKAEFRLWKNPKNTAKDRTKWALEIAILALEALCPN